MTFRFFVPKQKISTINSGPNMLRNRFAALLLASFAIQAHSFENEPEGFRSIKWGSTPGDVGSTLTKHFNPSIDIYKLAGIDGTTTKINSFPISAYVRNEDKKEFGNIAIDEINYLFYKDRFFAAVLSYSDSLYTRAGKYYTETGSGPRPDNLRAKSSVDSLLEKNFGAPTEKPGFLSAMSSKRKLVTYVGEQTKIKSECDENGISCQLVFFSSTLAPDFTKDLKSAVAAQRAEIEKSIAKEKAKADF